MKKCLFCGILICVFSSCDDIIGLEDISKEKVELLAPADGVTINNTTISFSWEEVEEADEYQLQVAQPSFEEAIKIVSDTVMTTRNYQETYEVGNFEWRVRALNSGYETEYTTNAFTITTE